MSSIAKCFVLALSIVASVNALATPHAARHSIHHRSLAARVVEPRSANVAAPVLARAPGSNTRRRCRNRTTTSSAPASTSSVAVPPINAAPIPTSTKDDDEPPRTTTTSRPASSSSSTSRPAPTSSTPTTTSQAPAPTKSSGGGGGGAPNGFLAGTQRGEGTFYDTGLGACGIVSTDNDPIIAVSQHMFDNYPGYQGGNPNKNPICGKKIRASRGGKSVLVTIVDRCVGCQLTDLDFSPTAFDAITNGNRGLGRIQIEWVWA